MSSEEVEIKEEVIEISEAEKKAINGCISLGKMKEKDLDNDEIKALKNLLDKGLVHKDVQKEGSYWAITGKGRKVACQIWPDKFESLP